MTPVEFPAPVGGWPQVIMIEHIESIERDDDYNEHAVIVLASKRRVHVGCSIQRAVDLIVKSQGAKT